MTLHYGNEIRKHKSWPECFFCFLFSKIIQKPRNKAVAMIRSPKRKCFCNAFEENKGNSRGIWKTIRTLTGSGKNRCDINSISIGEAVIDDKKLMAQHFNAHFSSIADRLRSTLPQVPSDPSKLQDFVRSRKSPDTSYVIPSITSAQVLTLLQS